MNLWVFDNDGTLYDDRLAHASFMKILASYASKLLDVSIDQVSERIAQLKEKWGTELSIVALAKETGLDFSELVENTYLKIELSDCQIITPDLMRLNSLNSLDAPKVVFTNNPASFARRVLSYVGLEDCFLDVIGVEETSFLGKPNPQAYQAVRQRHPGFEQIIFCDDLLQNLAPARELGWKTIWYRSERTADQNGLGHLVINSFEELPKVL